MTRQWLDVLAVVFGLPLAFAAVIFGITGYVYGLFYLIEITGLRSWLPSWSYLIIVPGSVFPAGFVVAAVWWTYDKITELRAGQ